MEALFIGLLLLVLLTMFGLLSLVHTSPTINILPYCALAAINATFGDTDSLHILMLVSWIAVFLALTVFCGRTGIRITDFRVVVDSSFASPTAKRWRFALLVVGFVFAVAFWLSQSGAEDFSSQKRFDTGGDFYMFANFFTGVYILFAIYVLGMRSAQKRLPPHYLAFALAILGWSLVQGYLASSRATFFFTILLIVILRMCQQSEMAARLRLAVLGLLVVAAQIPILAQIAEERANREGEGYQILYDQTLGADSGYGFAVAKDEAVYEYVRTNGPTMEPVYMLGGFYGLFPRVWWEDKPAYVDSGPIAGALVFRDQYWVTPGASIPISFPAEMAFAFGTRAFWVGLILYALLAAGACLAIKRWPILLVPVILFITQLAGGGLPKSVAVLVMNLLGLLLLTRLVGLRVVRVSRSRRVSRKVRRQGAFASPAISGARAQ